MILFSVVPVPLSDSLPLSALLSPWEAGGYDQHHPSSFALSFQLGWVSGMYQQELRGQHVYSPCSPLTHSVLVVAASLCH